MPRIGDTIRPELGRTDYSAMVRGGEAMGQGFANIGQTIGTVIKDRKETKGAIKDAEGRLAAYAKLTDDPNIQAAISDLQNRIGDEENFKLSERGAMAKGINDFMQTIQRHEDREINKVLAGQDMEIRRSLLDLQGREFAHRAGMDQALFPAKLEAAKAGVEATRAGTDYTRERTKDIPAQRELDAAGIPIQRDLAERDMRLKERGQDAREMAIEAEIKALEARGTAPVLTPAQKATQETLGKDLAKWESTGKQTAVSNLKKLDGLIEKIEAGKGRTGYIQGRMPGILRNEGRAMEQEIEGIVFQTLKETLGAQFTEKEGKSLVRVSYDKTLPEEANLEKLKAVREELLRRVADRNRQLSQYKQTGYIGTGAEVGTKKLDPADHSLPADSSLGRLNQLGGGLLPPKP